MSGAVITGPDAIAACLRGECEWPNLLAEKVRGRSETPCTCGQHWDLIRGRCFACWMGVMPGGEGFWRSVAAEDRIDNREAIANDRAEEQELRELIEEEERDFIGVAEPKEVER